jgi:hypothetical protein
MLDEGWFPRWFGFWHWLRFNPGGGLRGAGFRLIGRSPNGAGGRFGWGGGSFGGRGRLIKLASAAIAVVKSVQSPSMFS